MSIRYAAQRYGTWEWLDLELPFETDGPEWALSTYGVMTATVPAEVGMQKAEDGRSVLEEWGTLIHVETGEGAPSRRWTGIVTRSELAGTEWTVTVNEFPGYLDGMPIENKVWGVKIDPTLILKQIWDDLQAKPKGWLGVTVSGSTSIRVGTDSDDLAATAKNEMDTLKKTLDILTSLKNKATNDLQKDTKTLASSVANVRKDLIEAQAIVNQLIKDGASKASIENARENVNSKQDALAIVRTVYGSGTTASKSTLASAKTAQDTAKKNYDDAKKAYDKAKEKAQEDGGAYKIMPQDLSDAASEVKNLCDDTGLEWVTETRYSTGPPELYINVKHPRVGRVREDILFEQGVNVISELRLVRDGEEYANTGVGIGAGEGTKAIRARIPSTSERMRRVAVIEDKTIKKVDKLGSVMRAELKRRTVQPYVEEIEVVDHPFAPMFSWNVGDDVIVQGSVPYYGEFSKKHRIVSWQMLSDNRALLQLKLSSTF